MIRGFHRCVPFTSMDFECRFVDGCWTETEIMPSASGRQHQKRELYFKRRACFLERRLWAVGYTWVTPCSKR